LTVGIAGYLWWRHYQTTPSYSLALIIDAAQRNDMTTFNRLVNSEKIVDGFTSRAADRVTAGFGLPGSVLSNQLSSATHLVPERLKTAFRDRLVEEIRQFSSGFGRKPFVVIALTLPTVVKVTSDERSARLESKLYDQPVELLMEKHSETWQLVGVKNESLLNRFVDEVRKDLPAVSPTIDSAEPKTRMKKRRR
jgi:hypothetical protein